MKRPGPPRHDIAGQRFGRLIVDTPAPARRSGQGTRSAWWCLCDSCAERLDRGHLEDRRHTAPLRAIRALLGRTP